MSIEYGFTKIRFTCSVYRPKSNYGTSACVIQDIIGNNLTSISGGNHFVCPTTGTKEHIINQPFIVADYITLNRYIDTRSDGNSTMKVELYDSYAGKWITVLNTNAYRTGNRWENEKFKLTKAVASQPPIVDGTVLINFHQGSAVHSVKLTRTRVTKPSMIFTKGNEILYGSLTNKDPGFDTFKVNGKFLTDPLGYPGIVFHFEMQMSEYRSHSGVGGRFRRIQVFNSSGEDITAKCSFDANRFWYSIYDHKYHQHWPTDDRNAAINQVKVGFDGNYNTVMQGIARSSKNHTANGWIRAFLVCPKDEYIDKVVYQFGDWHRKVTYRLGYYTKDNIFKSFENFWIENSTSNFDKTYYLKDYQ